MLRSLRYASTFVILIAGYARAQTGHARAFTIDDALSVRSARIQDVSKDGHWIALSVQTRRDGLGVDASRYGDPTYVAPALGEFELIDATNDRTRAILPGKVDARSAAFSDDGAQLAFFLRKGDDYALDVDDVASNRTRTVAIKTTKAIASNSPLVWAPSGKFVLVALRPDGWAAGARAAFVHITEGEIVVQDAREPFLAWDSVRNVGNRQIPAVVNLADGSVREIAGEVDMRGPQFTADGTHFVYSVAAPTETSYDNRSGTRSAVFRVDIASGKIDTLLEPVDRRVAARWNDDGSAFAYDDRGNVFVRYVNEDSARNLTGRYRAAGARGAASDAANRDVASRDTARTSYAI